MKLYILKPGNEHNPTLKILKNIYKVYGNLDEVKELHVGTQPATLILSEIFISKYVRGLGSVKTP